MEKKTVEVGISYPHPHGALRLLAPLPITSEVRLCLPQRIIPSSSLGLRLESRPCQPSCISYKVAVVVVHKDSPESVSNSVLIPSISDQTSLPPTVPTTTTNKHLTTLNQVKFLIPSLDSSVSSTNTVDISTT